jgi:arylsulfatase A-like enzyme
MYLKKFTKAPIMKKYVKPAPELYRMKVPGIHLFLWLIFLPISLQAQQRPNIIFILADDMGYKDLGCYGNPFNETPHLDQLATGGMKFTQAYAAPACSPSRAAFLTGKHPARLHLTQALGNNRIDPNSPVLPAEMVDELPSSEITLAEILKESGYTTGIVGKWHLGNEEAVSAHAQGFDYDRIISKNGLDYYHYAISSRNQVVFEDDGTHYLTDKLTEYGLEFLREQKGKPFFLYMAYSAPHVLIVPKADKLKKYLFKYNKFDNLYNPYYASMIESLDDGVGAIVEQLKNSGIEDNTLIIFMSDNGGVGMAQLGPTPTSMEPLRAWKGHVYEGGIRVPLIMHWQGKIQAKVVNEHYINITDFLPTILELTGVKGNPNDIDGKSFLPIVLDNDASFDRGPIFWHYPHFSGQGGRPAAAVRNHDWKLVENLETGALELYNLQEDVAEKNDLSAQNQLKTREMYGLLDTWRKSVQANMPEKNPAYKVDQK